MLQNKEVCGNTIYSSSEASGVNHIIHRCAACWRVNTPTNVLSCSVLVTRFLRKQWHVTSHVFEVA